MIVERTVEGLIYSTDKEKIDKIGEELTKITEYFIRAVNVEALRHARDTGRHSLSHSSDSRSSVALCRAKAFA